MVHSLRCWGDEVGWGDNTQLDPLHRKIKVISPIENHIAYQRHLVLGGGEEHFFLHKETRSLVKTRDCVSKEVSVARVVHSAKAEVEDGRRPEHPA